MLIRYGFVISLIFAFGAWLTTREEVEGVEENEN